MAEIITFSEASAQFATADGAFQTLAYARDVRISIAKQTYRYRVPYAVGYSHIDLQDNPAQVTFTTLESPDTRILKVFAAAATPGTVHCKFIGVIPAANGTGGWLGFSGTLDSSDMAGQEGNAEQSFSINGWFQNGSAY